MLCRTIVAGSRTFNDPIRMKVELDRILNQYKNYQIEIVSGNARGADQLSENYAIENNYLLKVMPADWSVGKNAGYIRNTRMARYAFDADKGVLVAFWDGKSKGTSHMINIAKSYGLEVHIIYF